MVLMQAPVHANIPRRLIPIFRFQAIISVPYAILRLTLPTIKKMYHVLHHLSPPSIPLYYQNETTLVQ